MKRCTKCGIEKDESEFYTKGDKLHARCKSCEAVYRKAYYAKNREKEIEYAKNNREHITKRNYEWRQRNQDKVKKYRE